MGFVCLSLYLCWLRVNFCENGVYPGSSTAQGFWDYALVLLSKKSRATGLENQLFCGFTISARGADMNLRSEHGADARFSAYVEGLASVVGHADRIGPLRD